MVAASSMTAVATVNKKQKDSVDDVSGTNKLRKKLPVTLISGFLGSGKTTLLQYVLKNKDHGLRCAVIVNDMGEINVDGSVITNKQLIQREEQLVQLQNGCICCTLRQDLLEEIVQLASDNRFDYIIIESTGISEPMQVAETFTTEFYNDTMNEAKDNNNEDDADDDVMDEKDKRTLEALRSLSECATLDTCVTTVDASTFFEYFHSAQFLSETKEGGATDTDERTVVNLLIDQIEFANVILVNKIDTCSKKDLEKITKFIHTLNPGAKVIPTKYSQISSLHEILNTGLFNMEIAMKSPGWLQSLKETHVPETIEYGITSFVYRSRYPFHPQKIFQLIKTAFLIIENAGYPSQDDEDDHEHDENGECKMYHDEEHKNDDHDHKHTKKGSGANNKQNDQDMEEEEEEEGVTDEEEENEEMDVVEPTTFDPEESKLCYASKKDSVFQNVLRSKGLFWLANRNEFTADWSQAGIIVTITNNGTWLCDKTMEERENEFDDLTKETYLKYNVPIIGDRRQEMVFIGTFQSIQEQEILKKALDDCLLIPNGQNNGQQTSNEEEEEEDPWDEWF